MVRQETKRVMSELSAVVKMGAFLIGFSFRVDQHSVVGLREGKVHRVVQLIAQRRRVARRVLAVVERKDLSAYGAALCIGIECVVLAVYLIGDTCLTGVGELEIFIFSLSMIIQGNTFHKNMREYRP